MKRLSLLFAFLVFLSIQTRAATINVNVGDDFFNPSSFVVALGDTIVWSLSGSNPHTTTSTTIPAGAAAWDYTFIGTGDIYYYIPTVTGDYDYVCTFHAPGMSGSFLVVDNSLPFVEEFDYPAGDTLTNHGWSGHSGGTTNAILLVSPSLVYSGYPSSGIGNAASLTTSGQDVNRQFTPVTSGTVYGAFLVNVTSAQSNGDYFFHLGLANTTSTFYGRVFVKLASNGNLSFGLSKTSTSTTILPAYSDSIYSTGTTYLLVVKYQFNPDVNDDTVSLFINPSVSSPEPTPSLTHGESTANDPANVGGVYLRQGSASNAANVIVDGIRISTTWESVLPVELSSFSAIAQNNGVLLSWSTASEINNSGFAVERKQGNTSWSKVGFVNGNGTTSSEKKYSYFDGSLSAGKYQYRLKQIDFDGSFAYSNAVEVIIETPSKFELSQNYPNPFNPSTKISYSVPKAGHVTLKVYNALGQEVATLVNVVKEAGIHTVDFNASNLNSGIYFYKLEAGSVNQVKKMTLIK